MVKALLLAIVLIPAVSVSQPVVKGYAWHQSTAAGVKPAAIAGENGDAKSKSPVSMGNHFIFLEYKPGQNILPFRIWVNGSPYRVSNAQVESTPVKREREAVGTTVHVDTLVAQTNNQVVQVTREASIKNISIPPLPKAKAAAEQGKIVVEYYWRAKRYAYIFPEIKILQAAALQ